LWLQAYHRSEYRGLHIHKVQKSDAASFGNFFKSFPTFEKASSICFSVLLPGRLFLRFGAGNSLPGEPMYSRRG